MKFHVSLRWLSWFGFFLSLCLFVHLSVSVSISVCLFACLSMFVCLFVCLSVLPSICLCQSVRLSFRPSVCLCQYFRLSVYVRLFVSLSVCPSVHPSVCHKNQGHSPLSKENLWCGKLWTKSMHGNQSRGKNNKENKTGHGAVSNEINTGHK